METKALYIHIPFCDHICSYCDFAKVYYREEFVLKYLERLKEELDALPSYNENYLYRRRNTKCSFFKTIRYLIKYG